MAVPEVCGSAAQCHLSLCNLFDLPTLPGSPMATDDCCGTRHHIYIKWLPEKRCFLPFASLLAEVSQLTFSQVLLPKIGSHVCPKLIVVEGTETTVIGLDLLWLIPWWSEEKGHLSWTYGLVGSDTETKWKLSVTKSRWVYMCRVRGNFFLFFYFFCGVGSQQCLLWANHTKSLNGRNQENPVRSIGTKIKLPQKKTTISKAYLQYNFGFYSALLILLFIIPCNERWLSQLYSAHHLEVSDGKSVNKPHAIVWYTGEVWSLHSLLLLSNGPSWHHLQLQRRILMTPG